VTGVVWNPWLVSGQLVLTSVGLDGGMHCWKLGAQGLSEAPRPARFNPASGHTMPTILAKISKSTETAYGVAASGNGLVLAVVRSTGVNEVG
jgi:hypothetical protein